MAKRKQIVCPAAGCLAVALEVECSEGRDPKALVAQFAQRLEDSDESSSSIAEALASQVASPRARRAVIALSRALSCDVSASRSTAESAAGTTVTKRLQRCLAAVDRLEDFCDQTRRGKFGAIMALGCVARAGRAWIVVLHLAGKPSRESDGDSNPLRALPAQLPILLDKLCAGELIDVRGMTNTLVQRALLQIFECLNLEESSIVKDAAPIGEGQKISKESLEGFGLPERKEEASLVRRSLELLSTLLREFDTLAFDDGAAASGSGPAISPIDPWSGGKDNSSAPQLDIPKKRAVRGPAMPTPSELKAAAAAVAARTTTETSETPNSLGGQVAPVRYGAMGPPPGYVSAHDFGGAGDDNYDNDGGGGGGDDDDDDDDDEVGPRPSRSGEQENSGGFLRRPLAGGERGDGQSQAASKRQRAADEWSAVRSGKLTAAEAAAATADSEARAASGGREQWMLEAPSGAGYAGGLLNDLKRASVPTARGFQQMLPHSRQWAGLDDDDEMEAARRRLNKPDAAMEAAIQRSKDARGAPLMEQHQAAMAKQGKKPQGGRMPASAGGAGGDFSWDHEEMMGASRRMNAHDVNGMVVQAQSLDSKFSRSVYTLGQG